MFDIRVAFNVYSYEILPEKRQHDIQINTLYYY
jgi:hypothetical protein